MKKRFILTVIFVMILIPMLLIENCGFDNIKTYTPMQNSGDITYKIFVTDNATPRFSFEYPSAYEIRNYNTDSESKQTSVKLSVSLEEEEKGNIGYLQINVDDEFDFKNTATNCRLTSIGIMQGVNIVWAQADSIYPAPSNDVNMVVNWRIDDYQGLESARYISNYSILEKNHVYLDGIEGWEIVFSFTELPLDVYPYKNVPVREKLVPVISRYLYFYHQDMIWEISLYGAAVNDAQNKAIYEHVIKTIKIFY